MLSPSLTFTIQFNLVLIQHLISPIFARYSISIPPENVKKAKDFLTFSGGIKMEHWAKMS